MLLLLWEGVVIGRVDRSTATMRRGSRRGDYLLGHDLGARRRHTRGRDPLRLRSQKNSRPHVSERGGRYERMGPGQQSHTIRRAVEIVATQLRCGERDALEALERVATAADEILENVALHVLEGTVRFDQ
jgi:hypothetical protein